jgi:hypothetical protein
VLRASSIAAALAAAATEALTAVVRGAGVHLAVGDPGGSADSVVPVNAGACAIAIAMCMVIGTALAALISRRASRPARTYRITASMLVVASLTAPLTAAAAAGSTRLTLVAAHLLSGAIIVPLVSRSLPPTR